jgi:hypothetical protein
MAGASWSPEGQDRAKHSIRSGGGILLLKLPGPVAGKWQKLLKA